MKILTLRIKNIASIEEGTIDFGKGILAAEPIFLICGETGSGKTTILNAICLALYKRVPYFDTVGDDEKGRQNSAKRKDADNLLDSAIVLDQIKNPEQLLRRGAKYGEASLSFIGNDGHQYNAVWEAHPNQQDKSKVKSTHKLYDETAKKTYTAVNEIKKIIEQAVGLNFEQFCRTTMLAQGQFSKFICAKDDEKEAILEKLTATERFSVYGTAVHEKYISIKRKYDVLSDVLNEIRLLSDAEKTDIERELALLLTQTEALAAAAKAAQHKIDWLNRQQQLLASQSAEQNTLDALKEQLNSPDFINDKSLVDDWDATAKVRSDIALRDKAAEALAADLSLLKSLSEKVSGLLGGVEAVKDQSVALSEQSACCQRAIDEFAPHKPMIDNCATLLRELSLLSSSFADLKSLRDEAKILADNLAKANQKLITMTQANQKARDLVESRTKEVDEAAKKASSHDLAKLDSKIRALDNLKSLLLEAKACRKAILDNTEKETEAANKISDTDKDIKAEKNIMESNETRIKTLDADVTRLEGEHQGKLDLKNALMSIRQRFADTKECPLCGSKVDHLHTDEVLADSVAASLKSLELARANANAARSAMAQAKAVLKGLEKMRDAFIAQRDKHARQRKADEQNLAKMQADCPQSAGDIDGEIKKIDSERPRIAAERETATASITTHNNALKQLGEANNALLKTEQDMQRAASAVADCKANIKTNSDAIASKEADIRSKQEYVMLNATCGIIALNTADDCTCAQTAIKNIAADYKKAVDAKEKTDEKLSKTDALVNACRDTITLLKDVFPDVVPGEKIQVPGVDKSLTEILQKASALQGSIDNCRKSISDANARIDDYFRQEGCVTPQRVDTLCEVSQERCDEARKKARKLHDAENRSIGALSQLAKDIAAHAAARPDLAEDESTDSIAEKHASLTKEITRNQEKTAELKQLLKDDTDKRLRMQSQLAEKEQLEQLRDKWLTLDRLYGGDKGANFRRIAQIHVLANLLERANYFMRDLDDRYRLTSSGMSLNIYVSDRHIDAAPRAVNSLSGGEGFLASLALALALSTISKERIDIDILFIDEGFGTLSPGPLDKAMNTLRKLSDTGNRRVGIISHVEALRTLVPAKIQLERTSQSTSRLRITDR